VAGDRLAGRHAGERGIGGRRRYDITGASVGAGRGSDDHGAAVGIVRRRRRRAGAGVVDGRGLGRGRTGGRLAAAAGDGGREKKR
jgi:hypothetical protein